MSDQELAAPNVQERTLLTEVLQAIRRVRHGYVHIIVQDGKAIQIDTTEKKRLDRL